MVSRVKLEFIGEIEFTDRWKALKQLEEIAEKGTVYPLVIYGPEGCGKSALIKQAIVLMEELDYKTIALSPLEKTPLYTSLDVRDIVKDIIQVTAGNLGKAVWIVFDVVTHILSRKRGKIAILIDDVFQVIGLEKVGQYVKMALNIIEYPPAKYESIVVIITTSEGFSRREIGRHRWAEIYAIWNMQKEGFKELYNQFINKLFKAEVGMPLILDEAWKWTGGNPDMLRRLYRAKWSIEKTIQNIAEDKEIHTIIKKAKHHLLEEALTNPDILLEQYWENRELIEELVERNLIILNLHHREGRWIDEPPPEKDVELGIGRYVAWQTPIHREAVRKALQSNI